MINSKAIRKKTKGLVKSPITVISPDTKEQANIQKHVVGISTQEMWSGPIPPPAEFLQYEHTLSGSADRILAMAENEQAFRHKASLENMRKEWVLKLFGLIFAFLIVISMLSCTIYLYLLSKSIAIAITLIGEIAVITGIFITGSIRQRKETNEVTQINEKVNNLSSIIDKITTMLKSVKKQ